MVSVSTNRATNKILYVDHTPSIGGAEVSLLGLLEHLDRSKFEPLVALPGQGLLADHLLKIGVPVVFLPLNDGDRRHPWLLLNSVWQLVKLIKQEKIALTHANIERCNRPVTLAARLAGVPQICHMRNIQTKESFRHFFVALSPFLITNSHATEDSYARYMRPSQTSCVIYNGVDLRRFSTPSSRMRSEWGIGPEAYVIAQVGRIVPEKGIHLFIGAFSEIANRFPNVRGVIVGDISVDGNQAYHQRLRRQVAELGLNQRILFTGHLDDMPRVYGAIDLLVQPSIAEPFGRTLIEAMAMQVPVISTKAGGAVEVVENGKTGLLVPPQDVEALAKAILRIMENRDWARQLGQTGRKRVEEEFTIEEHARRVQQVYSRILSATSEDPG